MFIGTKEQLLNALRTMPIRGGMGGQCVAAEAADEIERLRAENERLLERIKAAESVLKIARPESGYWDRYAKEALK